MVKKKICDNELMKYHAVKCNMHSDTEGVAGQEVLCFLTSIMPAYSRDSDNVRKLSAELEQLRIHACQRRVRLSETLRDLISYCNTNMAYDPLINPDKENPFKPRKKVCQIL
ncbi:hypothetical protein BaRGS_00013752 [Batillaria attramentaria]|uniref:G protein gamma domain-containing protein n=1 Tax=Batillaria attramentaria TaxID=370345 RepID=A0ABD0L6X1_9CAEN